MDNLSFLCRGCQGKWILLITFTKLMLMGGTSLFHSIGPVVESDFLRLKFAEMVHGVSVLAYVTMLG